MLKEMPITSEHLSSLRQEITDLKKLNTTFREQKTHSQLEKSALEQRAQRLLEIKQQLSQLMSHPDTAAWW